MLLLEIHALLEAVEDAQLSPGLKNSLSRRLDDAREALAGGDVQGAIAGMSAFIHHAAAAGNVRHVTAALIGTAEEIRQRLRALLAAP